MNRKKAIKRLLVFTALGISSTSLYEWATSGTSIHVDQLPQKKQLIAALAETIIPRTDTPGAKDAQVENFIIKMIRFNTDLKTQHHFLAGLADLEKYTLNEYHCQFTACTWQQKTAIIKHFEAKGTYAIGLLNKINNKLLGKSFFSILKDLSTEGYCTSMPGATQGMAYLPVPVIFEACIPLTKNQKAWATK